MFGWLRKLFSRKKYLAEEQEKLFEVKEPVLQPQPEVQEERMAPHSSAEPERPEKICPKCNSPNDKFVHVCWMCKAEI